MTQETLRDKDIAVLQAIENGASTVSEIKEAITLTTREINYSLTEKSLEEHGLVEIERVDGREWQEINGQEKNIWKPKTVSLTDQGLQLLAEIDPDQSNQYEDMTKQELIELLLELEDRQDRLENVFKAFRDKIMDRL